MTLPPAMSAIVYTEMTFSAKSTTVSTSFSMRVRNGVKYMCSTQITSEVMEIISCCSKAFSERRR